MGIPQPFVSSSFWLPGRGRFNEPTYLMAHRVRTLTLYALELYASITSAIQARATSATPAPLGQQQWDARKRPGDHLWNKARIAGEKLRVEGQGSWPKPEVRVQNRICASDTRKSQRQW